MLDRLPDLCGGTFRQEALVPSQMQKAFICVRLVCVGSVPSFDGSPHSRVSPHGLPSCFKDRDIAGGLVYVGSDLEH